MLFKIFSRLSSSMCRKNVIIIVIVLSYCSWNMLHWNFGNILKLLQKIVGTFSVGIWCDIFDNHVWFPDKRSDTIYFSTKINLLIIFNICGFFFTIFALKIDFPMNPNVRLFLSWFVSCLVGQQSVCHNFLERQKVILKWSYWNTYCPLTYLIYNVYYVYIRNKFLKVWKSIGFQIILLLYHK